MWFCSFLVLFPKEPRAFHVSMPSPYILKIQMGERENVPVPQFTKVQKLGNSTQESHSKHNSRQLGWKEFCGTKKQNFPITQTHAFSFRAVRPEQVVGQPQNHFRGKIYFSGP